MRRQQPPSRRGRSLRFEGEFAGLGDKIESERERMQTKRPGEKVTFADAARALIAEALAARGHMRK